MAECQPSKLGTSVRARVVAQERRHMISSQIDVYEARRRKAKGLEKYKKVVKEIKKQADKGESGCFVSDSWIDYDIDQRLSKDGFDTSTNLNGDSMTWIFWG